MINQNGKKNIRVGNKEIGDGRPCYIIAEIGTNHNGSVQIARQLIKRAVECGADAVKFQKRDIQSLYQKNYLSKPNLSQRPLQYLMSIHNEIELSEDDYKLILEYCQEYSIQFLCTPFDKESVNFLEKLKVPAFKIGSPDMTNFDLLEYVCSKKKPLLISTGMSTIEEIEKTVKLLRKHNADFVLLHCNSNYPAPFHDINLSFMNTLKKKFNVLVGYSGHEYGIAVSSAAVALGACVVERHFTLDRTMIGPDHAASLEPVGFQKLIRDIRFIEEAMGSGKKYINQGEYMNRQVLGKSLVTACEIKKGEIIKRLMITAKSPGTGVSPQRIEELIGKQSKRHINKDEQFLKEDFVEKIRTKRMPPLLFKHPFAVVVRPHELEDFYSRFTPNIIEFHLTDKDVEELEKNITINKNYPCELVVHAPEYWGHDIINYASEEKRVRLLSISLLNRVSQISRKLRKFFSNKDKVKIIIHPGGMYQFSSEQHYLNGNKYYYNNLALTLDKVDLKGVELLLENVAPLPWYFGGQWAHTIFLDADEIVNFCRKNNFHICLDISHAALYTNYKKIDLYKHLEKLFPLAKYLHVADAEGIDGEGLQINQGSINFKKLHQLFNSYKWGFTPEIWQGHQNTGEGFMKALIRLNKLKIL